MNIQFKSNMEPSIFCRHVQDWKRENIYKDVFEDRWTFSFCVLEGKRFNHFDVPQRFFRVTDFVIFVKEV